MVHPGEIAADAARRADEDEARHREISFLLLLDQSVEVCARPQLPEERSSK
jgi:hypothetical protein